MKNTVLLFSLILIFTEHISAQIDSIFSEELPIQVVDSTYSNVTYYVYKKSIKAKPVYKRQKQALNTTAESLMESIMSATSQDWVYFNTYSEDHKNLKKKESSTFEETKRMNRDSNYFLLRSKFCFDSKGKKYCFMKFGLKLEQAQKNELLGGCHFLVEDNGRWYKTVPKEMAKGRLTWVFLMFKPEVLMQIFKIEKTGNSLHDNFIDRVTSNNKIDLGLLTDELFRIATDREDVKEEAKYFLEDSNW